MSFPTVYYITQVIPSCYSAGYAMCVCVSFGACVYRSLDSTHLALITLVDKITKSLDNGDIVIGVFIGLKKAFDTVNQKKLFEQF